MPLDLGDPRQVIEYALLAKSYGRYEEAIRYFQEALKIYNYSLSEKDRDTIALIYHELGKIFSEISNYNNALHYYHESLKISLANQNKKQSGITYNSISNVLFSIGKYYEGAEYLHNALKIFSELNDKDNLVDGLITLSNYYQILDNYEKSIFSLNKAIEILESDHQKIDIERLSLAYHNKGILLYNIKKFDEAVDYLNKALNLINNRNPYLEASIYYNLSVIFSEKGNLELAKQLRNKSIELKKKMGDTQN